MYEKIICLLNTVNFHDYMGVCVCQNMSKPIIINVSGVNTHLPATLMFTKATRF